MVKSKKNDAVCTPAPDEKSVKKGKRNAEDDIGQVAKKQKTSHGEDENSKVKKEHGNKPKPPASNCSTTPLPNSLFVSNLSSSVSERKLKKFFKNQGPIVDIKFNKFDDGSSKGSARVEFATAEAVEKACKLNNNLLMDRQVKLNYGHEHRMINPDSSSFEKPAHFSEDSVIIRGFDPAYNDQQMVVFLEEHFKKCNCDDGTIGEVSVQKDSVSGASEGVAFMAFTHPNCIPLALSLDGTVLRGFKLQVEKAKHVQGAAPVNTLPVTSIAEESTTAEESTIVPPTIWMKRRSTGKRTVFSDDD